MCLYGALRDCRRSDRPFHIRGTFFAASQSEANAGDFLIDVGHCPMRRMPNTMEYAIASVIVSVVLLAAFVGWRYTSVARGARQRDEPIMPLIDPIGEKLATEKPKVSGVYDW